MDLQPPWRGWCATAGDRDCRSSEVRPGDLLAVRPGERIAVDGAVRRGRIGGGRIHAHRRKPAGGESAPAVRFSRAPSTAPAASAIEANKVGRGTVLQQMVELVRQAQGSRAPVARLADVVSGYFTAGSAGGGG